jgi:dihydrofolate reductase
MPGQRAYPNMNHYIFSNSLKLENADKGVHVQVPDLGFIRQLKMSTGSPIYLCGGGEFAGWLLENELIDILKIKLNPLILGEGIKMFGSSKKHCQLKLLESGQYEGGLLIIKYKIEY